MAINNMLLKLFFPFEREDLFSAFGRVRWRVMAASSPALGSAPCGASAAARGGNALKRRRNFPSNAPDMLLLPYWLSLAAATAIAAGGEVDIFQEIDQWRAKVSDADVYPALTSERLRRAFSGEGPSIAADVSSYDFDGGETEEEQQVLPEGLGTLTPKADRPSASSCEEQWRCQQRIQTVENTMESQILRQIHPL